MNDQRGVAPYLQRYSYDAVGSTLVHHDSSLLDDQLREGGRFIHDDSMLSPSDNSHGLNFMAPILSNNVTAVRGLNDVVGGEGSRQAGVFQSRPIEASSVSVLNENSLSSLHINDDAFALQTVELSGFDDILRQLNSGNLSEINASLLSGVEYDFNSDTQQVARDASNTPNT